NDLAIALELNLYVAKRFLQAPQKHGPKPKWDKSRQYICQQCRDENHPNIPHITYWEATSYIPCPCKTCVRV
ncbi:MAG: hypothetical protein ACREBA_10705, partial [Nitrosotalea sp.]